MAARAALLRGEDDDATVTRAEAEDEVDGSTPAMSSDCRVTAGGVVTNGTSMSTFCAHSVGENEGQP